MYTAVNAPAALAAFIADVEELVDEHLDSKSAARGVEARLAPLVRDPGWLADQYREADASKYRTHLIAVAPSRRFSVLSLVWLPGQVTAVHDHITWCVVGVLQGKEREQRYGLRQGTDTDRWLVPLENTELEPGSCSVLIPPEENIHQVRNAGESLAISIHVYGADIAQWGSSINQCFDDLPIRSGDETGIEIPWRRSRLLDTQPPEKRR
jgi:predicted metal-dependent enzyme (double-stranded beta helix superfamily)